MKPNLASSNFKKDKAIKHNKNVKKKTKRISEIYQR